MCQDHKIIRCLRKEEKLHELDELSATLSVEFLILVGDILLSYNFRDFKNGRWKEYTKSAYEDMTQDRYCCHPFFNEGLVVSVQVLGDCSHWAFPISSIVLSI